MSRPELVAMIREEIARRGPLPFARFMELALYHPEYGYYSAPGEKIGWKGDYYTNSSVHPVFGALLAQQIFQMDREMKEGSAPDPFTLVEVGAGKGTLCFDILNSLQQEAPKFFSRLQYIIVEKSGSLRARQMEWLTPLFPNRLRWEDRIPAGLVGGVLSNELLDAFPVHRLRVSGESVEEVYVDWAGDHFMETLAAPSTSELPAYLKQTGVVFDTAIDLEVNLRALDWMREVGQALARGFVVTIDYGYPAEALYSARRPKGTFLCYHRHTANENPYDHVGEQDMTAHVDFTSLAKVGEGVGLSTLGFTDQTHFLMGLGIAQRMEAFAGQMEQSPLRAGVEAEEARRNFLAMKQLMAPEKMGRVFKILIQSKGVSTSVRLDGLQFKPFFKLLTFFFLYFMI